MTGTFKTHGIEKIFTKELVATNVYADHATFGTLTASSTVSDIGSFGKLCVSAICVTEDQLKAMLAASAAAGAPGLVANTGAPSGPSTPDTHGADTAATTTSAHENVQPEIHINGNNPATVQVGASYADLGATITGPKEDLNLGLTTLLDGATTTQLRLDTSAPGTHTIIYTVTTPRCLTGSVSRTVIVSAATSTSLSAGNDNHAATLSPPATTTEASSTPPTANDKLPPDQLPATGSEPTSPAP